MKPTPTIPILTIDVFPFENYVCGFAPFSRFVCFSLVLPNSWRISWRIGDYLSRGKIARQDTWAA
jgi:hypothetical protein